MTNLLPVPFPPPWAVEYGVDADCPLPYARVDCDERTGIDLRWIPPGTFWMGSLDEEPERLSDEGPRHRVTLTQGFWLGMTAVTQAQWLAVMGKNPSRFPEDPQGPVEGVTWDECQDFCVRLHALTPSFPACLPTEAQWEYACRAGTETPFSFGATIDPNQVNYDGHFPYAGGKKGLYRKRTVPVASLPPNPWGLYEMHGNVWEWCRDGKRDYTELPIDDPVGPEDLGRHRVMRGGSWINHARRCRSACRNAYEPGLRDVNLGFRLAAVQSG